MSRRKGEIGISNKENKEWLPTFNSAVNDVRNFEYSIGHTKEKKEDKKEEKEKAAAKAEKKEKAGEEGAGREALSAVIEERPIRLHLEAAAYQDVLKEFDRLKKAQAALRYDEILMHPEMEATQRIAQKKEMKNEKVKETKISGESKAAEELLKAVAEAKKRKAAERSGGKK